nr:FKBP-type peptidyl-prolyl cis-trans isomerase [Desulfobacula sp.]
MRLKPLKPFLLLSVMLLSLVFSCTGPGTQPRPTESEGVIDEGRPSLEEAAGMEEIQKKISAAIEEAQRTGKTRVDIVLDEDPVKVQPGDLVEVACRAALENGKMISNQEGPVLKIIAGTDTRIPGMGYAVLGMGPDGKKTTVIEPEQAFGAHLAENTQAFPVKRTIPRDIRVSTEEYKKNPTHFR